MLYQCKAYYLVIYPQQDVVLGQGYAISLAIQSSVPAIGDCDGDLDSNDFAQMADCLAGPNVLPAAACPCTDVDGDLDADLRDFAAFQVSFTGP